MRPYQTARHVAAITTLLAFSSLTASLALIVYQEILVNPLEIPNVERVVSLLDIAAEPGMEWPAGWNTPAFSAIGVFQTVPLNIGADIPHQRTVLACIADPAFFDVLAVGAERGRLFNAEDAQAGAAPVALVSREFWISRFGDSQDLTGAKFFAAGHWIQVIGVLPAKVVFPAHASIYLPHPDRRLAFYDPNKQGSADDISQGSDRVIARLRPGYTVAQARGMVRAIVAHLRQINTDPHRGFGTGGARLLRDTVTIYVKGQVIEVILAGVLVALVGLLSLFFLSAARTAELQKDIAIRVALGAGRNRLFRREMIWWLSIGSLASAAVLALAEGILRSARTWEGLSIPRLGDLALTVPQAIGIVAGTMAVAVLLSLPYLFACRKVEPVTPVLNRGESQSRVTVTPLVGKIVSMGELSLAIALTGIAVTVCVGYWQLALTPPGMNTDRVYASSPVLASSLNLGNSDATNQPSAKSPSGLADTKNEKPPGGKKTGPPPSGGLFQNTLIPESKSDSAAKRYIMDQEISDAAGAIRLQPGVATVAIIGPVPYEFNSASGFAVDVAGRPLEWAVPTYTVAGNVPETLGINVLQGRWFEKSDYADNVVIISDSFSKRYFGGHPLGKTLYIEQNSQLRTIVGVVNDVTAYFGQQPGPAMYLPLNPHSDLANDASIVVKMASGVTRPPFAVRNAPGNLLQFQPWTSMEKMMSDAGATDRASATVAAWFAILVLLLSAAGAYAVFWMITIQRQREMAIRICFGALPAKVALGLVLNAIVLACCAGIGGFAIQQTLQRVLSSRIYQFPAFSWTTFLVSFGVIALATLLSVLRPARSVLRISPAELLPDN